MFETIQDHETRIVKLEKDYSDIQLEMNSLKNIQLQTQNTLLEGNKHQNELLNQIITQTFGLRSTNNTNMWKTVGIAAGSGGFLVVVVVGIIELFQKFL